MKKNYVTVTPEAKQRLIDEHGLTESDFNEELKKVFTCQICGMPKTHHRLYGYRCDNPEHAEMEHELEMKTYTKKQKPST